MIDETGVRQLRRRIVIVGLLLLFGGVIIASISVPEEESVYTAEDVREPLDVTKILNPPPNPSNVTFWGVYVQSGNFVKFDALAANGTIRVEIYTIRQDTRNVAALFNQTGTSFTQIYPIYEGNTYYVQIRNQNPHAVAISGKIRIQKTVTTTKSHNIYPYAIWGLGLMIPGFVVLVAGMISKR